jgi:hypothetical protein
MKIPLIGLAGPAGSGKDTVALVLESEYGYWRYAFAKPLKEALSAMGIVEPTNREDKELRLIGKDYSYRTAAQTLGTEWARNLDPEFWLSLATANTKGRKLVVVSDVRFTNEADWIRNNGGEVWHIAGRSINLVGSTKSHRSEVRLRRYPFDIVIDNSVDIDNLKTQISDLVNKGGQYENRV